MDTLLIFDFGSQTSQLIARRLRDQGYFARIVAGDCTCQEAGIDGSIKGIILSGSPFSVYEKDAPKLDQDVFKQGIPILGICYGLQRITQDLGGSVEPRHTREYGRASLQKKNEHLLLKDIRDGFQSWMSHGDSIQKLPHGFEVAWESEHGIPAMAFLDTKTIAGQETAKKFGISAPLMGIQFHPEVSHCESGQSILHNFAEQICSMKREWDVSYYLEEAKQVIAETILARSELQGTGAEVLLLISGGVDSTVLGALLLKTMDPDKLHLLYVDTGMMRNAETDEVKETLKSLGAKHVHIVHAENDFLGQLAGKSDPEEKRQIIGDLFITIQNREIVRLGLGSAYLLAQGTLYTDLIESGKGVGKHAAVIKSHHNVRSPLVESLRNEGRIIEPLAKLYKDEVRALGKALGLSPKIVWRHPFPGPGLAVRILGEVDREKCAILRAADKIFIDELHKRELYHSIWQAFCVLLPVRSVGVAGDMRGYGYVLALRAIVSSDGMTADVYPFEMKDILEISGLITNQIKAIGRVVYDISSKPPATIEWE